ncbi:MAG TPA: radical SAM protein [Thermodesulfobacteriota bacterium]
MAKRILFAYPPSQLMNREDRCQVPSKNIVVAPPLPPTDLMYMAASAEAAGALCMIRDYTLDGLPVEAFIKDLSEFRPDCLVVSTTTPTLDSDLQACKAARETIPGILTVAKGAHFTKFRHEVLENYPHLDAVIRGETELVMRDIAAGIDLSKIEGIAWRSGNKIVDNAPRPFIADLDSLPFPARHLVDNSRYVRPDNRKIQGVIKVSRGCPFNCFFCLATAVSGSKVRRRSHANILAEIRHCMEEYGMKDFLFWSDIFNLDRKWVMDLCAAIMDSGLRFNWATNTRVDTIDLEMAKMMKKAGCTLVSVGIESGSQEILDRMGKKTDLEQIRRAFRIFRQAGLKTFAYYIIGLAWETRETFEETIRLAIELDSDYANFFTATAFPGTRFFEYAVENNLFQGPVDDMLYKDAYYYPTVKGHHLTQEEILGLYEEAVRRFFFRPSYIVKRLVGIRSVNELKGYSAAGLAMLRRRRTK